MAFNKVHILTVMLGIMIILYKRSSFIIGEPRHSEAHPFVRILNYDPLIMHIENFISSEEAEYMLRLGEPLFQPSSLLSANGTLHMSSDRTSSTAIPPAQDPTINRIIARAAEVQGFSSLEEEFEVQLTRYHRDQGVFPHTDWFGLEPFMGWDRVTTFFVILKATCAHCGTRFPNLRINCSEKVPKIRDIVDCNDSEGITVKAVPGSATFWRNLHLDGTGDDRTLHLGLPPEDGTKVGMNIWTIIKPDYINYFI